jgi:hypothetical protein
MLTALSIKNGGYIMVFNKTQACIYLDIQIMGIDHIIRPAIRFLGYDFSLRRHNQSGCGTQSVSYSTDAGMPILVENCRVEHSAPSTVQALNYMSLYSYIPTA